MFVLLSNLRIQWKIHATKYYTFKFIQNCVCLHFFASRNCVPKWRKKFNFIWNFFFLSFHITHTQEIISSQKFFFSAFKFRITQICSHYTRKTRRKKGKNGFCLLTASSPFNGCDTLHSFFSVFFFGRVKKVLMKHTKDIFILQKIFSWSIHIPFKNELENASQSNSNKLLNNHADIGIKFVVISQK